MEKQDHETLTKTVIFFHSFSFSKQDHALHGRAKNFQTLAVYSAFQGVILFLRNFKASVISAASVTPSHFATVETSVLGLLTLFENALQPKEDGKMYER